MLRIASAVHFFVGDETPAKSRAADNPNYFVFIVNYEQQQQSFCYSIVSNMQFPTPNLKKRCIFCLCSHCLPDYFDACECAPLSLSSATISAHSRRIFAHFVRPKCKLWTSFAFRAKRKCLFYAKNELIRRGRGSDRGEDTDTHTLSTQRACTAHELRQKRNNEMCIFCVSILLGSAYTVVISIFWVKNVNKRRCKLQAHT